MDLVTLVKKKSVTRTVFVTGFAVCTFKLLISGISIGSIKIGEFSGVDFAAAVGALGAIYTARQHSENITKK